MNECLAILGINILPDNSPPNECNFNLLYRYNKKLYYTWVCCECNTIDMAFDCDGIQLCDFTDDCMIDFNDKAEFIGYFL